MVISSYQTLARYHDGRQSNRMPDIRQQLREDLFSSRSETRLAQLFKKRRLYDTTLDECEDDDACDYDFGYDETDYQWSSSDSGDCCEISWPSPTSWQTPAQLPPSNAPSPSLSHDSDYCSSNSSYAFNPCDTFRTTKSTSNPKLARSRKQILELRKRVQKSCYSVESVRLEYQTLKQHITSGSVDQKAIGFIMCSSWNVLASAMNSQDEHLSRDSLNFLTQLIINRLVRITDILFILQQGLILTIKDTISRLGTQQADVVALLISIIYVEPRAASYLIELITDTDIVKILEDFIEYGTNGEAVLATKFYSCLFDIEISLVHRGNYTPIVPETLSRTNSTADLAKTYCPALSLKRIIRPSFIAALIGRFYKPIGDVGEELFKMATVITAYSMELIYINLCSQVNDPEWVRSVMYEFEVPKFDEILVKLVQTHTSNRYSTKTIDNLGRLSVCYSRMTNALSSQELVD